MLSEKFKSIVKSAVEGYHDPWADRHIERLPAEKVTRHRYIPSKRAWVTDISLIKIESEPFDRGAQRQIYRLKKISQAPTVNWRKIDWAHAPNYVAKCYITSDGKIGTDDKIRYFNDVKLQYEAAHWATIFNKAGPPKGIHVIQCYVLEFTDRPDQPVVGCERFVDGHDKYGAGFVKHNSNSGYVDSEENRATPQAFSAHSFYASAGKLMVVDVQGVGDLYTDPQIHTQDDRFGNSDLGIRGMALFFVSFRRNFVCDYLKLPRFPLSKKERDRMLASSKPVQCSDSTGARKDFQLKRQESLEQRYIGKAKDTVSRAEALEFEKKLLSNPSFSTLSPSEQRAYLPAVLPPEDRKEVDTALNSAIAAAFRVIRSVRKKDTPRLEAAVVQEIVKDPIQSLELFDFSEGVSIDEEIIFTTMDPEMIHLHFHDDHIETSNHDIEIQSVPSPNSSTTSIELIPEDIKTKNLEKLVLLQKNTGEVHLELATLEAAGRFSLDASSSQGTQSKNGFGSHTIQSPLGDAVADVSSCVFHLAEASVLGSCAAALALGRLRFGLSTDVLLTLSDYIPRDQGSALALLMLSAFRGSATGACLAGQMCDNAGEFERAISLYQLALCNMKKRKPSPSNDVPSEDQIHSQHVITGSEHETSMDSHFESGAEIEVNYLGCDSWYPAIYIEAINETSSKIRYVDGDQEDDVVNIWIRSRHDREKLSASDNQVDISTDATESHHHTPPQSSPGIPLSSSPQSNFYLNGQMSIPSTVTSIGPIGSDEDIQYTHKLGIGSDDVPSMTTYEILHSIGRLHGLLAQKYTSNEAVNSSLCSLAVKYFNEASSEAFEAGKTAFAMKCIEDSSQYE